MKFQWQLNSIGWVTNLCLEKKPVVRDGGCSRNLNFSLNIFFEQNYHLNMIITYKINSWDFLSEYPLKMAYDLKNIGGWNG